MYLQAAPTNYGGPKRIGDRMQIIANGISLEVEDYGPKDGIPLILIRGLGSQLIHWPNDLVQVLAKRGYRTVVFDNRDVGLSQRCPGNVPPQSANDILDIVRSGAPVPASYSLSDMAQDVIGLMDALQIKTAHIFGISMGGAIAQLLCLDHADRLRSATIVMTAMSLGMGGNDVADFLSRLLSHPVDRDTYIEGWVQEHASHGSPGYPMPDHDIRAEAALAWSRGAEPEGVNRQLMAIMTMASTEPRLGSITLPCQVIHGVDDALIPVALGAAIADNIPNCDYHPVPGMGHIITPSLAPVIIELVDTFIRSQAA